MQYRKLLHEWVWHFHEPKVSKNAAHECNNCDMYANKYLLLTATASCLFSHKVLSNLPFECTSSRPWRIMLKNCVIMLCSNALKCFDYASKNCYYAHGMLAL